MFWVENKFFAFINLCLALTTAALTTAMWYIYETSWPPNEQRPVCKTPVNLSCITQLDRLHVTTGSRCSGILYHVIKNSSKDQPLITKLEIQSLNSHFWSSIGQTPFHNSFLAIVISKDEWLQFIDAILHTHCLKNLNQYQLFASTQEAVNWLEECHQYHLTHETEWPPITFSSLQ